MRIFADIGMLLIGFASALAAVSVTRLAGGAFGMVQVLVIVLALAVFYLKENKLAALAAGAGIGLDTLSVYPYLTWFFVLGGTTIVGWWISKNVLTNRSLPSLIFLGAAMRVAYFVLETAVSRLSGFFGGTAWYNIFSINFGGAFFALGIEMIALAAFFIIHVRLRGERSRMLTHL